MWEVIHHPKHQIDPTSSSLSAHFSASRRLCGESSPLLLQLSVSSFKSQAPRRLEHSAASRKGAIRGSKRGDFTPVWGDSREVGGPLRYRFGVAFSTTKNLPVQHKHRPHQHLNFPPTSSASPNTICARTSTPKSARHSAFCTLKSAFPRAVGWWSISSRLLVGHRSFDGRLVVGHRSVSGRLVVGLFRPSTPPSTPQTTAAKPLEFSALSPKRAQHDLRTCAHKKNPHPTTLHPLPPAIESPPKQRPARQICTNGASPVSQQEST